MNPPPKKPQENSTYKGESLSSENPDAKRNAAFTI